MNALEEARKAIESANNAEADVVHDMYIRYAAACAAVASAEAATRQAEALEAMSRNLTVLVDDVIDIHAALNQGHALERIATTLEKATGGDWNSAILTYSRQAPESIFATAPPPAGYKKAAGRHDDGR